MSRMNLALRSRQQRHSRRQRSLLSPQLGRWLNRRQQRRRGWKHLHRSRSQPRGLGRDCWVMSLRPVVRRRLRGRRPPAGRSLPHDGSMPATRKLNEVTTQVLLTVRGRPPRVTKKANSRGVAGGGVGVVGAAGGVVSIARGTRSRQPVMPRACQGTAAIWMKSVRNEPRPAVVPSRLMCDRTLRGRMSLVVASITMPRICLVMTSRPLHRPPVNPGRKRESVMRRRIARAIDAVVAAVAAGHARAKQESAQQSRGPRRPVWRGQLAA